MRRIVTTLAVSSVLASLCCFATGARAAEASDTHADSDDKATGKDDAEKADDASGDGDKKEAADKPKSESTEKGGEDAKDAKDAKDDSSPVEVPGKTYYFVGARYRGIIVPQFIQGAFASGGKTVYVHAFGPEFSIRKDNFEYNLSPWLAFYSMDDTAFKGKDDPETSWELINSNLKILYLTSDFVWSHPFSPQWALNYGFGAGFGIVFGELHRSQSYPTAPGQDPNKYSKCQGVNAPPVVDASGHPYCDDSNNYYGNYSEPSWANGGSKPLLFPWLAVQTGVRFKPSRTFAARLDVGFGTSGFFFGLGGDYGL
jgi:hypothetical protein